MRGVRMEARIAAPGAAPVEVRCLACFRTEQWGPSAREVTFAGGMRKLQIPATLHQWRVAAKCAAGEGVIVGPCPACAQPMVANGPWEPVRWEIAGEPQLVVLGATITDRGHPADKAAIGARLEAEHRARLRIPRPTELAVSGFMVFAIVGMLAMWVFAASFAINFIIHALPVYSPF